VKQPSLLSQIQVAEHSYQVDLAGGIDLSIPMSFSAADPNLYAIPAAIKSTFREGGMIGDTREGGSCNVETITITPHCHGTHTECAGHVTHDRISAHTHVPVGLLKGTLVTLTPETLLGAGETSRPALLKTDFGITKRLLHRSLETVEPAWLEALIIRTLPNLPKKREGKYNTENVPFFSIEAISYLIQHGVRHLLVDLPSLDRLHDNGEMAAHRTWWNLESRSHATPKQVDLKRTITELIFVPNDLLDGPGLVSIQIPSFESDAAPSRPVFYPALNLAA
jgi:arylformamidase